MLDNDNDDNDNYSLKRWQVVAKATRHLKIVNISKITASIKTNAIPLESPIKLATRNAKESFEFFKTSWILRGFFE